MDFFREAGWAGSFWGQVVRSFFGEGASGGIQLLFARDSSGALSCTPARDCGGSVESCRKITFSQSAELFAAGGFMIVKK